LLDWETLDKHQIDALMQGEILAPPVPEPELQIFDSPENLVREEIETDIQENDHNPGAELALS
jgi:hypothetical protein